MKHSAPTRSRKRRIATARRLRLTATAALAEQNNELTAEGSPPPGKVGLGTPAMPAPRPAKA